MLSTSIHDVTPATAPTYERHERREETAGGGPAPGFEQTIFVTFRAVVPSVHNTGVGTPTAAELTAMDTFEVPIELRRPAEDDAVARARDARIALMIRKYEGVSTIEDDARVQILTQRLRKLCPRVTSEEIDRLSTMVGELEQASADLHAIRSRFDLR